MEGKGTCCIQFSLTNCVDPWPGPEDSHDQANGKIAIYRFPWGPVAKYTYDIYDLHGQLRCINLQKNHPSSGASIYHNVTTVWNYVFC